MTASTFYSILMINSALKTSFARASINLISHMKQTLCENFPVSDSSKLAGLQAARAIAALSVTYYHSRDYMERVFSKENLLQLPFITTWGFLGVHLFFAISGFVICMVILRDNFTIHSFIIRRLFRIWPLYLLIILFIFYLKWFYNMNLVASYDFKLLFWSLTLFPIKAAPFYELTWSLEHEIVFYILAVFIVPSGGIWSLIFILAFFGYEGYSNSSNCWSYFLFDTIQIDFLAGVLAYKMKSLLSRMPPKILFLASILSMTAFICGNIPFMQSVSSFFFLPAIINARINWRKFPFNWLIELGNSSYALYMTHYCILRIGSWLISSIDASNWMAEPARFFLIIICCLASIILYNFFERPFIKLGDKFIINLEDYKYHNHP